MRAFSASLTSAPSSSNDASLSIAFSASARYIAPLSRFTYPSFRASREARVLLPAPAGPSMAIVSLREDCSSVEWSFIVDVKDCTRWSCKVLGRARLQRLRKNSPIARLHHHLKFVRDFVPVLESAAGVSEQN